MWRSHLNDMEIPETKRFTSRGLKWDNVGRFDMPTKTV